MEFQASSSSGFTGNLNTDYRPLLKRKAILAVQVCSRDFLTLAWYVRVLSPNVLQGLSDASCLHNALQHFHTVSSAQFVQNPAP